MTGITMAPKNKKMAFREKKLKIYFLALERKAELNLSST